jgi:hypothetical protein
MNRNRSPNKTPKNVYRRFVEFEEKAAGVYLRMASRFAESNPKVTALWLETAIQEKQHAELLQFCLAEGMFARSLPGQSEIRKFAGQFRNLEKRAASPALDLNSAFAVAADLEGSEVNAMYCYLTTPLHASPYLLRKKISSTPPDHLGRLLIAATEFGVAPGILRKLDHLCKARPDTRFLATGLAEFSRRKKVCSPASIGDKDHFNASSGDWFHRPDRHRAPSNVDCSRTHGRATVAIRPR